MLNDPKILVLDEPTAGLDPKERVRFRNILSVLSKDRIVILSTHIVSDIESIANHVIMIKEKQLLKNDTVPNICKDLEGKVFEKSINESKIQEFEQKRIILSMRQESEKMMVRYYSEEEDNNARPCTPNLEDVFLVTYKGGKNNMRIIINECKKILDIRIILLLCMFSILYYMTFTQIYRYPTGGQVTNTKYDIPFTAELVKEWGPKWKVKDEKQYQEKHQELERGFAKIIKQDQELSKRGIVDYEIFNKKYEELGQKTALSKQEKELDKILENYVFYNDKTSKIFLDIQALEHIRETICNDPQVCRIVDLPVYYELETNNGNRDYRIQIGGHYMNYNTVYVGMDVHKESFTLCSCKYEDEKASHYQRTPASYKNVLRYLAFLRTIYGEDTRFVCGYEAGCLGYSLYHQLENFNVECVILAPTTMLEQRSKRRIKTDKRDAEIIARSLAQHNYSPVHIPTETDNQTKEFIRMRDDHKAELKKIKQQILSFCLRQGYQYDGSGNWTAKHVKWLRSLKPAGLYKEILDEYLLTYTILTDKLNRLDQRIEELASKEEYKESVSKLTCFLGIKTHTALSVIVEVGDFQRFVSARKFAGYLGLVPGQHSSGDDRNGLGITKAGNTHVRRLLVESAQSYTRGKIGYKSRVLRSRQAGNSPQVINYADRANERLRRRYYKMVLKDGKKYNIAKTAIARELACFIWGMMTDNIY